MQPLMALVVLSGNLSEQMDRQRTLEETIKMRAESRLEKLALGNARPVRRSIQHPNLRLILLFAHINLTNTSLFLL